MPSATSRFPLILAVLLWLGMGGQSILRAWETKTLNGREYVAVEGMKGFYGFSRIKRIGTEVTREN